MRRAYAPFAFQHHEDVTVVVVIMHVILDLRVKIDNPKGGKTVCFTLEVATFRVVVLPEKKFLTSTIV